MRKFILILMLLSVSVKAEMVVVVNPKNATTALSLIQVQEIFLGRVHTFPDGQLATPVDQATPLRSEFYQAVTQRPIEQVDAYWARIMFTGRATPPQQLPDDTSVLNAVSSNEGGIGFIDRSHATDAVRVVLVLP